MLQYFALLNLENIIRKKPKNSVTTTRTRILIEEQTTAFLKFGGAIQQVFKGTSGPPPAGVKQPNLKNS